MLAAKTACFGTGVNALASSSSASVRALLEDPDCGCPCILGHTLRDRCGAARSETGETSAETGLGASGRKEEARLIRFRISTPCAHARTSRRVAPPSNLHRASDSVSRCPSTRTSSRLSVAHLSCSCSASLPQASSVSLAALRNRPASDRPPSLPTPVSPYASVRKV